MKNNVYNYNPGSIINTARSFAQDVTLRITVSLGLPGEKGEKGNPGVGTQGPRGPPGSTGNVVTFEASGLDRSDPCATQRRAAGLSPVSRA